MMEVKFCPYCGTPAPDDQGGDEDVKQFQCAGCDAFFSIRLHDREGECLENCPACGKESDNYSEGDEQQSLCSSCALDATRGL